MSNDVRRFDDAGTFWPFLVASPVETILVLVLVALEIGWIPSIVGVSTVLCLIPQQVIFSYSSNPNLVTLTLTL
jgi:hypothetical protein